MTTNPLRPQNGSEYLESLNDGREVWIYGEKVENVTTHPAFRNYARSMARLFDALHDGDNKEVLTAPTDTGSGGFTHPFFKVQRSIDDLRASRAAIERWQELGFGWMGRSPDYKASITSLLGADPAWFGEYSDNALAWYRKTQENVLHIGHAIVNPPVDRNRRDEDVKDVFIHVEKETDNGLIVSGAKVVATGSPITQYCFVAQMGAPISDKSMALTFFTAINAPGVKLVARNSYEAVAARASSPFDYPLSSRLDENDAILIFDHVLIPWENVLIYDVDRSNAFLEESGWGNLAMLQSATRMGVKLDFISGLLSKALEITGNTAERIQVGLGEVINTRHLVHGMTDAMIARAEPGRFAGTMLPNGDYMHAYAAIAPQLYRRVREIVETIVSSGLIYLNSHASDFENPELRPYLDRYMRGSNGTTALDRSRVMKALWDATGSEFGSRHSLYELNYFSQPHFHHLGTVHRSEATGQMAKFQGLVEKFFADYDVTGFTAPDLINADDLAAIARRR